MKTKKDLTQEEKEKINRWRNGHRKNKKNFQILLNKDEQLIVDELKENLHSKDSRDLFFTLIKNFKEKMNG